MGQSISQWPNNEPPQSFQLPFTLEIPGTACIVASPRSIPSLSDMPVWIFHAHLNRPGFPLSIGTYIAIHRDAADFCHPAEPAPQAQGRIDDTVYLNDDWLAFRVQDLASGATHWLALPQKLAKLSPWQRFQGWWAHRRLPKPAFTHQPTHPTINTAQITFPGPALSTTTLWSSEVSVATVEIP